MSDQFQIVPYREKPEYLEELSNLEEESFPAFINDDPVWNRVAPHFYKEFAEFQFFVVDTEKDKVVGLCNNVPFNWDGNPGHLPSYQEMLTGGLSDWQSGNHNPNTLSGVLGLIDPEYRGQGLPELMGLQCFNLTQEHKITSIMIAVRPTLKDKYPLVSIEEYVTWKREDGQMFDPWLRSQEQMGAELVKPEPKSTVIEGSIADWERWTDMKFPVSGEYWLPGGLSTLHIDLERGRGVHYEPHVWYKFTTA